MIEYFLAFRHFGVFLIALLGGLLFYKFPKVVYLIWVLFLLNLIVPIGMLSFTLPDNIELASYPHFAWIWNYTQPFIDFFSAVQSISEMSLGEVFLFLPIGQDSSYQHFLIPFGTVLMLEWILISLITAGIQLYSYWNLKKNVQYWEPVRSGPLHNLLVDTVDKVGLGFVPRLYLSPYDNMPPFTIGFLRKNILIALPVTYLDQYSEQSLRTILCHELSHIRNRDSYINLLQLFALILFHIHPLRILTSRFIRFYQEVCCDMNVIHVLGMQKKEYLQTVAQVYLRSYSITNEFASAMVGSRHPFVKRLLYVQSTPLINFHSKYYSHKILLALLFFVLIVNVQRPSTLLEAKPLIVSSEKIHFTFPEPERTHDSPIFNLGVWPKYHDGIVWVRDQNQGLFSFHFDDSEGLIPVDSFTVDQGENSSSQLSSMSFYGDHVYITLSTYVQPLSAVHIFQYKNDGSFKHVNTLEFPNRISNFAEVIGSTLWLSDSSDHFLDSTIRIFDLADPSSPQEIDSRSLETVTNAIEQSTQSGKILVSTFEEVLVLGGERDLRKHQTIPIQAAICDIQALDSQCFVALALDGGSVGIRYKLFPIHEINDYFYSGNPVEIIYPENDSIDVMQMNVFKNHVILNSNSYGLLVLKMENDEFSMVSHQKQGGASLLTMADRIVSLYPQIAIYSLDSFIPAATLLSNR